MTESSTLSRRGFLLGAAALVAMPSRPMVPWSLRRVGGVSGLALLGATTAEMTTTSRRMVTLATVEGIEAFGAPLLVVAHFRKTTGAGARVEIAVNGVPQPGAQVVQSQHSGMGVLVTGPRWGSGAVSVLGATSGGGQAITLGDVFVYRLEAA